MNNEIKLLRSFGPGTLKLEKVCHILGLIKHNIIMTCCRTIQESKKIRKCISIPDSVMKFHLLEKCVDEN